MTKTSAGVAKIPRGADRHAAKNIVSQRAINDLFQYSTDQGEVAALVEAAAVALVLIEFSGVVVFVVLVDGGLVENEARSVVLLGDGDVDAVEVDECKTVALVLEVEKIEVVEVDVTLEDEAVIENDVVRREVEEIEVEELEMVLLLHASSRQAEHTVLPLLR